MAESREMLNHSLRAVNHRIRRTLNVVAYQWTNRTHHRIHRAVKELTRRVLNVRQMRLNSSSGVLDVVRDVLAG